MTSAFATSIGSQLAGQLAIRAALRSGRERTHSVDQVTASSGSVEMVDQFC
jgi:hypothetical protein